MPSAATQVRVPCAICATEFVQKHRRQRYCSKRCLWKSKNDRHAENQRAWAARDRAKNPERHRAWSRAAYQKHRDKRLAAGREKFQRAQLETPWRSLIASARSRAAKYGHDFDLTDDWGRALWTGRCVLTGIEFALGERGSGPKFFSPSIDRIEPKLGYVQSNCRFVLHAVNAMKGDRTDAEVVLVAEAIIRMQRS